MNTTLSAINTWRTNARDISLPQSLIPAALSIALVVQTEGFSWPLALLALAGVVSLHLGLNLFDDYFDFRHQDSSHRNRLAHRGIRSRIAKCEYLTSGRHSLHQLLTAALLFCGTATALGGVILYFRGVEILFLIVAGALLGISYSAPPLRLSYHGLGELTIAAMFGPLLMNGVCFSATGSFSPVVLWVSIPVGILVMNVVYTHAIMDFEPDREVGKTTLAVLLNNHTAMLAVSALLLVAPFAIIAAGVALSVLSPLFLAVFLTLPMAIGLFLSLKRFTTHPHESPTPRWWMGPMSDWENICKAQIDWFMVRWLTSRNLISLFSLIILVVSFFD